MRIHQKEIRKTLAHSLQNEQGVALILGIAGFVGSGRSDRAGCVAEESYIIFNGSVNVNIPNYTSVTVEVA